MTFQNIKSLYFNIFLFLILKKYVFLLQWRKTSFYIKRKEKKRKTKNIPTIPSGEDDICLNHAKLALLVPIWRGVRSGDGMEILTLKLKAVDRFRSRVDLDRRSGSHTSITAEELQWLLLQLSSHLLRPHILLSCPHPHTLLFTLVISKGFALPIALGVIRLRDSLLLTRSQF